MKKKIILGVTLFLMLLTLFALSASAASTLETWDISATENDSVTATLYDDYSLVISGQGNMKDWTSSSNVPWYSSYRSKIKSVTIENGVNNIGNFAFYYCTALTSVEIGDSVTTIGSSAFYYCYALTSIVIPDSVTSIGSSAFRYCYALTSIVIPDSVTSIGEYAFYYCTALKSVVIGDSVTSIGSYAFYNCSALTSIVIPNSVTSIGGTAFGGCSSLESITLPFVGGSAKAGSADRSTLFGYIFGDYSYAGGIYTYQKYLDYGYGYYIPASLKNVTVTGGKLLSGAFYGCSNLTSIVIGNSVTSIGYMAFQSCIGLTSIVIPDSVMSIDYCAFNGCSSLESITLPFVGGSATATSASNSNLFGYIFGNYSYAGGIATKQYYGATDFGTYYIPASLKNVTVTSGTLFYGAFDGCSNLTSVVIGESVRSIGSYAFRNCYRLTNIVVPDSVTSIGSSAFSGCTSLTRVTIGDSVRSIDNYAFNNCDNLTSIVIPDSVTTIGNDAFYGCNGLTRVEIGDSVKTIGNSAFYSCDALTSIVIPDSVTSIGNHAFSNCTALTSVVIGNSVTTIGDSAFFGCRALTSVVIPDSVTSIGYCTFNGCSSLESLTIPFVGASASATTASDSTLFGYIFGSASYTGGVSTTQYYQSSKYCTYCIPASLKNVTVTGGKLFYGAFCGCSNLAVIIQDSVISVGSYAFYNCTDLTIYAEVSSKPSSWSSDWNYSNCPVVWGSYIDGWDISIYKDKSVMAYLEEHLENEGCYMLVIEGNGEMIDFGTVANVLWSYYANDICSITISDGVMNIGAYAFCNCSSVVAIEVPDSVTSIGREAFANCESLRELVIGDSVTSIGESAFKDCYALTNVTLPASVVAIGDGAFKYCTSLKSITVDKENVNYCDIDGNLYSKDEKTLIQYAVGKKDKRFEIASCVSTISAYAFSNSSSLTTVIIPKSVTTVGSCAFSDCTMLTIYAGATNKPKGWATDWNNSKRPIVWGYVDGGEYLENIFTFKGYSYNQLGSLAVGFDINYDAIATYEEITGKKLEIGVVFASYELLNGRQPLDSKGNAITLEVGGIAKRSLTDLTYTYYDFIVSGITEDLKDHRLVISAYIANGEETKYVQANGVRDTVSGITYNEATSNAGVDVAIKETSASTAEAGANMQFILGSEYSA